MKESLRRAVEQAKLGDGGGFSQIYRETCEDVYFRTRLLMGNRSEAQALLKQIYLVVFRTINTLQDSAKMEKWMYTVLYKLGERECRRKKGMLLEEENTAPSWEGMKKPETTAEKQRIVRIMKLSYKKLSTAGRMVCLAYYFEGWQIEELERLWKCPAEKLRGILEYARIVIGLTCTEHGYHNVDISPDMMYLMFELLREDAEEEIQQARLPRLYEEIESEMDYVNGEEDEPDDGRRFSWKWLAMILAGAAILIALAAAGGNYLGHRLTKNEPDKKTEEKKEEKKEWSLRAYLGNWCDETNAGLTVMDRNGMDEMNIKSVGEQKVVFDIRHTYGASEDYSFRGANDVTGIVSDKKASFTFTDEGGNRLEGTIEFLDEAMKVSVNPAPGMQIKGLSAQMECTMKRDKYYGERMTAEEEEIGENEDETDSGEYIFPDSDKRMLTEEDFEGKTRQELRIGRNEIFARRGRDFQTKDLKEWFTSKEWYEPKYSAEEFGTSVQLNEFERENSSRILQAESRAAQ